MSGTRSLLRRVNLRHLRERKMRTALTVAGIASGVALVFSVSIINATLSSSFSTSLKALAGVADIEVSAADYSGLPDAAVDTIKNVDGVDRAVPALRTVTQIAGPRGTARSLLLGITPEFPSLFEGGVGPPEVQLKGDFGDGSGIVLSQHVADEIGVRTGDSVRLTTPTGTATIAVTGSVTGDGVPAIQGGRMGIMTLDAARAVLARTGRLDFVWVTVKHGASVAGVEREIETSLGGAAIVGRPGERARGFRRAIGAVGAMTSLAGTAALFVSLFVVYNAMSISLLERRRELAMALALGGSKRQLFGAALGEAAVLGATSSAVGMGFGYVMARLLYDGFADQARILGVAPGGAVVVRPSHLAVAFFGGLVVAIAGAFVPARRILRVAPIESLRPEAALEWTTPPTRRRARLSLAAGLVTFGIGAGGGVLAARFPDAIWPFTTAILFLLAGASMLLPHVVPAVVRLLRPSLVRGLGTVGRLASDALDKNSSRTTLTVGTLVLTASLVVAINSSFGSYGMKIRESAHLWYGAPLYVTSDSFTGFVSDQPLPASLAQRIEAVEGVRGAYPMRYVSLDVDGEQVVMYALGAARAAREGKSTTLSAADGIDQRTFIALHGRGEIAVARFTARQRGLKVGSMFALPTPAGTRAFRVGAISNDLNGFESLSMEYETYASLWNADTADQFYVLTDPGVPDAVVESRIREMLRRDGVPAHVRTREGAIDDLVSTVLGLLSLAQLIGLAALIVAAITIANTMFTAVLERKWEFGLQRAVGMGRRQLGRSVLLEAGVIGALGGAGAVLLGGGLGFLMIQGMRAGFAWIIPFRPPVGLLVLVVLGGAALAAVAGSYPRRLAVRTPIIEALRYE
jgi:putative ABC transport system permease protein